MSVVLLLFVPPAYSIADILLSHARLRSATDYYQDSIMIQGNVLYLRTMLLKLLGDSGLIHGTPQAQKKSRAVPWRHNLEG